MAELKDSITEAMKDAMRAKDKARLSAVRLMLAEFKRIEVDERIELSDERVLAVLEKMLKQRRDSIQQFEAAGRQDLVATEAAEIAVIQEFMPAALSEAEINQIIDQGINDTGANSMKDMGSLMQSIRPQLQGRADMGKVSQLVKARLT